MKPHCPSFNVRRITALLLSLTMSAIAAPRPNIVVILCDDMGYSDIACYGGEINTPNLDRLANAGIRYTQAYNTAKCTTTRASLLTGLYANQATQYANYEAGATIGEVLQSAGYRTLWSGKNHSEIRPPERGFDRFYGFQGGACSFWNPGKQLADGSAFPHIVDYEWMVDDKWVKPYHPEDPNYYMTHAITDNALAWLEEYQDDEQPFFLYLAYNTPHWPLHAPAETIAKYKGTYDAGYEAIAQARLDRMKAMGLVDAAVELPEQGLKQWDQLSSEQQAKEAEKMEIHAAMVDELDSDIGRVIAKLETYGDFENTLILFLNDNGASHENPTKRTRKHYKANGSEEPGSVMTYEGINHVWGHLLNAPYRFHKSTNHEGGIRTPMIAHWPAGIQNSGVLYREPVHLVDFMSTFMELSGASYPPNTLSTPEGTSLTPSFVGEPLKREINLFFNWKHARALRADKWKAVMLNPKQGWELYNIEEDPTEQKNLADQFPEKLAALTAEWDERNKRYNQRKR